MNFCVLNSERGYTLVELMVTVVIVAVLSVTVGTLFVSLMNIQEREREQAYIRENLADICANYSDYLSVGTSVSNDITGLNPGFTVAYRRETGGVSLETGRVSHVVQLDSSVREFAIPGVKGKSLATVDLGIETLKSTNQVRTFSRNLRGDDTQLIPIKDLRIRDGCVNLSCRIYPLDMVPENAALWYLQVVATYDIKNDMGMYVSTNVTAGRVVRLWNQQ